MGGTKGATLKRSLASSGMRLSIAAIALCCLAVSILAFESGRGSDPSSIGEMELFQRMVGGLGMGSAAAPAWNLLHYDPRLQAVDDSNLWPIAGSLPYSPSAASATVSIKELPREDLVIRIER
jgi:hypothetical protein